MVESSRILLATDLSETADRVVATAIDLAKQTNASVVAIHGVIDDDIEDLRRDAPEGGAYVDEIFDRARHGIAQRLEQLGADDTVSIEIRVVRGSPATDILDVLKNDTFSYVVVGIRNRSRIGKLILGSVTQQVLLKSPTPVVAVPIES